MKKHVSSGAVIYIEENGIKKFLVMYRQKTDSWHLPKGTREPDETLEQTALREIKEETGLDVKLGKYLGKLDSAFERNGETIEKETNYFLATPLSAIAPKAHDKEHDEIKFFDYESVLDKLEKFSIFEKESEILKLAKESLD